MNKSLPINSQNHFLQVAALLPATRVLGPGLRAGLWVQGCPFSCPGCIAPEWQDLNPKNEGRPVLEIAKILLSNPNIEGISISGGEPMLQAQEITYLIKLIKKIKPELNFICFTGFLFEKIKNNPKLNGVKELLSLLDVLIDGPYISSLNNNKGLKGSSNQRIFHLSERLADLELENYSRSLEIHVSENGAMLVGIPKRQEVTHLDRIQKIFNASFGEA